MKLSEFKAELEAKGFVLGATEEIKPDAKNGVRHYRQHATSIGEDGSLTKRIFAYWLDTEGFAAGNQAEILAEETRHKEAIDQIDTEFPPVMDDTDPLGESVFESDDRIAARKAEGELYAANKEALIGVFKDLEHGDLKRIVAAPVAIDNSAIIAAAEARPEVLAVQSVKDIVGGKLISVLVEEDGAASQKQYLIIGEGAERRILPYTN